MWKVGRGCKRCSHCETGKFEGGVDGSIISNVV